jgi:hypothetical protein
MMINTVKGPMKSFGVPPPAGCPKVFAKRCPEVLGVAAAALQKFTLSDFIGCKSNLFNVPSSPLALGRSDPRLLSKN